MKRTTATIASVTLLAGLSAAGLSSQAQPQDPGEPKQAIPAPRPDDVRSIDAIVGAFYTVPAGARGQKRDWDRFRSLFTDNARLIPIHGVPHGGRSLFLIPVNDYIESNHKYFEKGGFVETELSRRVEQFGSIAQVWSTFESRRDAADPEPYARGIYSFQLASDGDRWYIVNVMWDHERAEPIPEKYLKPADR